MTLTPAELAALDEHLAHGLARELRHRADATQEWIVSELLALFHRRDELARPGGPHAPAGR